MCSYIVEGGIGRSCSQIRLVSQLRGHRRDRLGRLFGTFRLVMGHVLGTMALHQVSSSPARSPPRFTPSRPTPRPSANDSASTMRPIMHPIPHAFLGIPRMGFYRLMVMDIFGN